MSVLHELKVAALFLTRFPVRVDAQLTMRDLARAVYAFPIMGAAVGVLGGLGGAAAGWLGLSPWMVALTAVLVMIAATGALHEDGLADTADGLGAGGDREKALTIMRDSRIGSFGAIAITSILMARVFALAPLYDPRLFLLVLVAAGAVSRAAMAVVMLAQPSAKATGLAAETGRPDASRVLAAVGIALLISLLVPWYFLLPALLSVLVAGLAAATFLGRRYGGCTGDTLGAVQQLTEIAFLLAVVARL